MSASAGAVHRDAFDEALTGAATRLELADGRHVRLPVGRWHAAASGTDHWMVERCGGPTVDLGCGPGRLVAALRAAGVQALGVDQSRRAVRLCRERGAPALRRDLFTRLPGEGRWRHALLADGNIGIGGDPLILLRRARSLLAPGGSVFVETAGDGLWCGAARLRGAAAGGPGPWFPWATVGSGALPALAREAGLHVAAAVHAGGRGVAQLVVAARRG